LSPFYTRFSRENACLGSLELSLGGLQGALGHADLNRGPLHGRRTPAELLDYVGDPHLDENVASLDPVADVIPILFDIAGDPRIDRRDLESLDCSRLNNLHLQIALLGLDDPNAGRLTRLVDGFVVRRLVAVGVLAAG